MNVRLQWIAGILEDEFSLERHRISEGGTAGEIQFVRANAFKSVVEAVYGPFFLGTLGDRERRASPIGAKKGARKPPANFS
jgi:hypothetical protein